MAMRAYRFFRTSIRNKPPLEPADTDSEEQQNHRVRDKCKKCGKKLLMFMFSHVGLTGLVVGYSILGGVIFQQLESPHEIREKAFVGNIRSQYVKKLWESTKALNILHKPNWTAMTDDILKSFQRQVLIAVKEKGWDGSEGESTSDLQWTYAGSLLYAVTIITTIGYGHIAPKTTWGRVATIIYALIGIPLTLLCLANIGGALGKCFRFVYGRIMCGLCRRWKRRKAMRLAMGNPIHIRPQTNHKSCCRGRKSGCSSCCGRNKTEECEHEKHDNHFSEPVDTIVSYEATEADVNEEIIRVPVIVTLGIMAGYIFGGAMLFTLWEKQWDYLIGSYFCFITLSTIGFGDFVPGTSLQSWASQEKRLLCSLYLLFGLALLAMCFDLMQEQVRFTFRRIGLWIGIIEEPQ